MWRVLFLSMMMTLSGCSSYEPMPPVSHVDLNRFMGDWYVIAHIPSWPERNAYDAIESYHLRTDGRIQTDFSFRNGAFDQPIKTMHPVGTVKPNTNNAVWGMQFIWPIQAEYVIAYLDENYQTTIVARSKRDYVWIMARTPCMSTERYQQLAAVVAKLGYRQALRRVPFSTTISTCFSK